VVEAARELLMSEGFGRLTIEGVAARSGISKPTIYRHWSNATELAMAALAPPDLSGGRSKGSPKERLQAHLKGLIDTFATTRGRQVALTLASADPDSEYTKAFRNRVILESRALGRELLLEELESAGADLRLDIETLLDMIYGPIFYRLLVAHQPIKELAGNDIVEVAFRAIEPKGPSQTS
jgi:AcrR family transcriptional regulator